MIMNSVCVRRVGKGGWTPVPVWPLLPSATLTMMAISHGILLLRVRRLGRVRCVSTGSARIISNISYTIFRSFSSSVNALMARGFISLYRSVSGVAHQALTVSKAYPVYLLISSWLNPFSAISCFNSSLHVITTLALNDPQ